MTLKNLNLPNKRLPILLLLCLLITVAAKSQNQQKLQRLKQKYSYGSIYITYIGLVNLNDIVNDKKKAEILSNLYGPSTVGSVRAVLKKIGTDPINQSIAFMAIDLNQIKAVYKLANDYQGDVTLIPWAKDQVVEIADFCDKQLHELSAAISQINSINNKKISIDTAYSYYTSTYTNPFIGEIALQILAKDLRLLLIANSSQYELLKSKNPTLYEQIEYFRNEFDKKELKDLIGNKDNLIREKDNMTLEKNIKTPIH